VEADSREPRILPSHVPILDEVRGIAILLVIASHLHWVGSADPNFTAVTPWDPINELMTRGFLGVDLFFVLSGFLITSNLLRQAARGQELSVRRFYVDRGFRLLPALYSLLAASTIVAFMERFPMQYQWSSVWRAMTFASNWGYKEIFLRTQDDIGHLWSLAVEAQFYLVWPLIFVLFNRRTINPGRTTIFTIVLILLVILNRAMMWVADEPWLFIYPRTDTRIDALFIGCLVAFAFRSFRPRRVNWRMVALTSTLAWILIAYFLANPSTSFLYLGGFTAMSTLSGLIIYSLVSARSAPSKGLLARAIGWVGRISYGLYLWHLLVFRLIERHVNLPSLSMEILLAITTSFGLAILSYRFIEAPFLLSRKRRKESTTG